MMLGQKTIVAVRGRARSGFSSVDAFHSWRWLRRTILLPKLWVIGREKVGLLKFLDPRAGETDYLSCLGVMLACDVP